MEGAKDVELVKDYKIHRQIQIIYIPKVGIPNLGTKRIEHGHPQNILQTHVIEDQS